jgi:hypothetical protein
MPLLEMLNEHLGGDTVAQLGQRIGADPGSTGSAVSAALPLLISALARNATSAQGAQSLNAALVRDHHGRQVDDLPTLMGRGESGEGDGILRHVLGDRRSAVEAGISRVSGLRGGQTGKLLALLAPMVLAGLGRVRRERGLDERGLSTMLTGEREHLNEAAPGTMGALGRLLDRAGDGQVLDDVGGVLSNMFGRR